MHLIQDVASISNSLWFLYVKWMPYHEIYKSFLSCTNRATSLVSPNPTLQSQIFIDARPFSSMEVKLFHLYLPIFEQNGYESI